MAFNGLPNVLKGMSQALEAGTTPAAQIAVIHRGVCIHESSHGNILENRRVSSSTWFDVASLTKALVTTPLAAILVARKALHLDRALGYYLGCAQSPLGSVTLRQLLAHSSGLPAWRPLFAAVFDNDLARQIYAPPDCVVAPQAAFGAARRIVVEAVCQGSCAGPPGVRVYSDIGFILLGLVLECVAGKNLRDLFAEHVAAPLRLRAMAFVDLARERPTSMVAHTNIAPTGLVRPREGPFPADDNLAAIRRIPETRPGVVDDDNAYALGGVAGHAGLFATAADVAWLGWHIFEEIQGDGPLQTSGLLRALAQPDSKASGPVRALGFDLPASADSAAGRLGTRGPKGAIGHLGFTGCSWWLDLDRRLSVALLTNRVLHSRTDAAGIHQMRIQCHNAVLEALEGVA